MLSSNDPVLSNLARSLALELKKASGESIPREYLSLEGFRLTEEPKRKLKVLFLGGLSAWGEQSLKLSPKVEWLFHESDRVIINLQSPIAQKVGGSKRKQFIDSRSFFDFCDSVIAEKISFVLGDNMIGPLALETVKTIESSGANATFSSEILRLDRGLFLKVKGGSCEVKAQRDLALMETSSGKCLPITMENRKLVAQGLGSFVPRDESEACGILAQVEFALYEDWEIERVRWEPIKQSRSHGTRLILL